MLPALIWYVVFAAVVVFYLIVGIGVLFYRLSQKNIDGKWFLLQFSFLFFIGMHSLIITFFNLDQIDLNSNLNVVFIFVSVIFFYFSIIAIALYVSTKDEEKQPRNDASRVPETQIV